ncbi:MAG: hypothetical protein A2X25_06330 [Chloroflexi bacterium GWB2_49_20]|nr:MAG: hypothetical protein A2X25_06330 [Chloroflexi bacterium GWB2_49_20]OGN80341.1 MAG: hypothetical protein A2X26_08450 [Chloroflexi bacterium GWC2_49_37]OGN85669.1 MAG: hypothetical protein A2X27_13595 [Chloroflexi bacterium GWD2_49_16]HCC79317.1 branched-chain amino acid ABC transporter permease [Anaerolineae bacterium]HCM96462.1 branched-chain amino acid ABC transporter permease [Anaerolineae bacterium]
MQQLTQLIVNGLTMGCIYALIALGFVLIYRTVGVINFAQGELVMLAAYFGVTAISIGLSLIWAYVFVIAAMAIFGYLFQWMIYYPLRGKPFITIIISTIGVSIILQNLARIIWGPAPLMFPSFFSLKPLNIGGVLVQPQNIFVFVVTVVLFSLVYLLLSKTMIGHKMQAVAQDPETAKLMGIKVDQVVAGVFVLNSILAGAAGLLLAPIFLVTLDMGSSVLMKSFSASIIGGFGSVPGAIVGGLFLGVVEILGARYISSHFKDGIAFVVLLLVLLIIPKGLFGERVNERS